MSEYDGWTRIEEVPASRQAVCDLCGWHTVPYRNLPLVQRLEAAHREDCPRKPVPVPVEGEDQ